MDLVAIKQRFGIIGNNPALNRAIETAVRVAPTNLSVLVTGESGVGKEVIPKIIHANSTRKHNRYIAVNCGAIPEGTMDSELFGHVKGSFTGAHTERKGYFEEANGGTIFLDEVAEMPISSQVKLLRILETGEYMRVGSSKILKTDVRIIAATNIDLIKAIDNGKFREDLYYRLNTVPIFIPPLRERKEDIHLLFRKFANDFAEQYRIPAVRLDDKARQVLESYYWHGNIRQLKNITEQLSILEKERLITAETLLKYLPDYTPNKLPAIVPKEDEKTLPDKEILYRAMIELRKEVDALKEIIKNMAAGGAAVMPEKAEVRSMLPSEYSTFHPPSQLPVESNHYTMPAAEPVAEHEEVEESLSLEEKEKELIRKALEKHRGKRKYAAMDLGISERTLYRKIKTYGL